MTNIDHGSGSEGHVSRGDGDRGLGTVVWDVLRPDPFGEGPVVLCAKRVDRARILTWDVMGICLHHERPEVGRFRWRPPVRPSMLPEGLDRGRF